MLERGAGLHAVVHAKLTIGTLPLGAPIRLCARQSRARRVCVVCDRPIEEGTLEYEPEFEIGGTLVFHKHCFNVWYEERAGFGGSGDVTPP
jgi:hypothetical protein